MNDDPRALVRSHLEETTEVTRLAATHCAADVATAAHLIAETFAAGGKLLLCGNGGSAADCQHIAAKLVSRLTHDFDRPGLPAIALTTDSSLLTAFANDVTFEGIFARQVQALGRAGDALMVISTSGTSPNVLIAVAEAADVGMATIALTGRRGLREIETTVTIAVPSDVTAHVQAAHVAIEHAICSLVERTLFPRRGAAPIAPALAPSAGAR